jgi:hypothetical protein
MHILYTTCLTAALLRMWHVSICQQQCVRCSQGWSFGVACIHTCDHTSRVANQLMLMNTYN